MVVTVSVAGYEMMGTTARLRTKLHSPVGRVIIRWIRMTTVSEKGRHVAHTALIHDHTYVTRAAAIGTAQRVSQHTLVQYTPNSASNNDFNIQHRSRIP